MRAGFDPAEEKRGRRDNRSPERDTFGAVAQDYLERHLKKNSAASTYMDAKRDLEHNALPKWRNRPIESISRRDIVDLVDGILARGAEIQANRTLARLRALFNWAIQKDRLVTVSPVDRVKAPTKERTRDRALTDDELRWLWTACDVIEWPFGPLVKLLLITGQRRDEVASMEWPELDLDNGCGRSRAKRRRTIAHTRCICRMPPSMCCARFHAAPLVGIHHHRRDRSVGVLQSKGTPRR